MNGRIMTKLTAKYWLKLYFLIGLECQYELERKKDSSSNVVSTTTCALCNKPGNKVRNNGFLAEYWCPQCAFGWMTLDIIKVKKNKECERTWN